jgi:hypothetical protein
MTPGHDACRRGAHDRAVNAMQRVPTPIVAPVLLCGGQVHAERGEAMALDASAKTGSARVALAEDGAVFCRSCAAEAFRGGDDVA